MAINFPNSPSLNETYSENDTSWKWDGTSWNRLTGLVGTESSTLSGVGVTQFARRDVNNVITGITTLSTSGVGNTTLNVEGDSRFGSNIKVTGVSTFTGNVTTQADVKFANQSIDNAVNWGRVSSILQVRDDSKLTFGNANDLQLYHASNQSVIADTYGDLRICGNTIKFRNGGNTFTVMNIQNNGATTLYYSAGEKLATTDTGVSVTGDLAASGNVTGVAATFTGDVKIGGVLTYEDVKNIDSVGIVTARSGVNISNTTQSTSTTTGALKVAGGAGIVKNLNVGGTIHGTLLSSSQTSTGVILKLARTGTANGEYGFKLLNDAGNDCSLSLRDEKASATRLSISSDGNIGINNSAAKYALHFKNAMGSSPSWIHMEVTGSNTVGGGGGIAFDTSASNNASSNTLYLATIAGIRNSDDDGSNDLVFSTSKNGVNSNLPSERLRITSSGIVNIGSSSSVLTQGTYKAQIETGTNKTISFGTAAHDDLSNEGSGMFFSRQSDGSPILSGIFGHGNTSLGLAARADITFHAGGGSTYSAAPERLRITSGGQLIAGYTSAGSSALISIVKDTTEVLADNEPLYNNASPAFLTVYNSNNTGSGEEAGINIVPAGNANGAISIYGKKTGSYAGDLIFRFRSGASTSAERLRITSGGNTQFWGTRAGALQPEDDDNLQLYTASSDNSINRGSGITFYNHDNSGYEMGGTIQVAKENATADNEAAYMRFSTRPAGAVAAERLRITSAGQVQINRDGGSAALTLGQNQDFRLYHDAGGPTIFSDTGNQGFKLQIKELNLTEYTGGTTRLKLDSSGQIGVGNVTPKTWQLGRAVHIGNAENAIWGEADYALHMIQNAYYNSGYKYTHTDEATLYSQENGKHTFKVAASGTADSAITWVEALRILTDGKVGIGSMIPEKTLDIVNTSSNADLRLKTTANSFNSFTFDSARVKDTQFAVIDGRWNGNVVNRIQFVTGSDDTNYDDGFMAFHTRKSGESLSERLRIKSDGVVNIGDRSDNTWIDSTLKVRKDQNAVTKIAVRNENQGSSASAAIVVNSYGNSWMFDCGSAAKNSNALTIRVDATASSNQGTEKLRIDTSGHITPGTANTQDLGSASKEFKDLYIGDSGRVRFGSDQDMFVFHDNIHGYVSNRKANLYLEAPTYVMITSTDTNGSAQKTSARFLRDAGAEIYHANTVKLATTSTGITVTGEVAATQDYPIYQPTLDFNFTAVKKLDSRFTYSRNGVASYIDEYGYLKFVGDNVPRFDHDPDTGECLGLLIEESRTNILNNTGGTGLPGQVPANGSNLGNSPTQTVVNDVILPTGKPGSVKRVRFHPAGNTGLRFGWTSGGSANNPYSASVWARATTGTAELTIDINDHDNNTYNLTTEWVRLKSTGTTSNAYRFMDLMGGSGADVYIWGYQIEQNDHVSSYMPNDYPRGVETVTIEGEEFTDFYNQEQGTLVLAASYLEDQRTSAIVTIDDTSNSSEYTEVGYRAGGGGSASVGAYLRTDASGDQYYKAFASSATQGNEFKVAFGYKDDDYASSANGQTVHTDTSGTTSKVYDRLRFNHVDTVSPPIGSGHIRRFIYYPKRLPNNQLKTLTS